MKGYFSNKESYLCNEMDRNDLSDSSSKVLFLSSLLLSLLCLIKVNHLFTLSYQCATFVGNSYQTFGLATDKTYQTKLKLTGPNKNNDF